MARTIDASSLVTLPRLDAASARTLVQELATAAKAEKKKLPKDVAAALAKVVTAEGALAKAARTTGAETPDQKAADHAEDAVWSGLFDVLTGYTKLPEKYSQNAAAQKLLDQLFPDRLAFTRLPFKAEWAEVESRIKELDAGLDASVRSLAGEHFLEAIREVHAAYGEALGVTKTQQGPAPKKVKVALLALAGKLRTYVLKVAALADEDDAKSTALAARLLDPVTSWEQRRTKKSGKPAKASRPTAATSKSGGAGSTES